jgi:pimeloyl-ACP methyl ester carboxylesterase
MAKRLRTLRERVLVVLGSLDRLVRDSTAYVAALAEAGAPIDMAMIDGGGHAVNEERADEVAQLALAFLKR